MAVDPAILASARKHDIALFLETIAGALGLIEPASYGAVDIGLMCFIATGVLWVFSARRSVARRAARRTSLEVG
jgi:hypothetical protein